MAVNRVDFGGNTLIDLTGDTLESAEQLLKGIIAHAKDGSQIVGALKAGGGGGSIWGGKFTTGSFVLSEEKTSKYTIAKNTDEAMTGLLYDGETISDPNVYPSIGLLVLRKPTELFDGINYPKCLVGTVCFPTYYGSGSGLARSLFYMDNYGSMRATTGGANVGFDELSVKFTSAAKGSPDFEYMWLAWRHLK